MTDPDPIELAMREIQPTGTEPAGRNPFAAAADQARKIVEPPPQKPIEVEKPPIPTLASLPRETAIRLRWSLRDIDGKRTRLSPVGPEELRILLEMGLVEMKNDVLSLTTEGHRAIR